MDSKRQLKPDSDDRSSFALTGFAEDMTCSVCLSWVIEAVQTACCGNLYCRKCIVAWLSTNSTCPICRVQLRADGVSPDFRAERLSSATDRPCTYYNHGCQFTGDRAAMTIHEYTCAWMPQEARESQITQLLQISEGLRAAALGPEPALQALKTLYGIPPSEAMLQIRRNRHHLIEACTLKVADATFALEFDESNYHLGVYLRKLVSAHVSNDLKVSLLHPKHTALSRDFYFPREMTSSITPTKAKGLHAMTSLEFDAYCVQGHFFVLIEGALVQ